MVKKPRKTKVVPPKGEPQIDLDAISFDEIKFDDTPKQPPVEEVYEYVESHPPLDENGKPVGIADKKPAVVKYVKVDPNKLVIRVDEKGNVVGHPIPCLSMKYAFGEFDPDNLPPGFEHFKRIPFPELAGHQVYEGTEYIKVDGVWQDQHKVKDLTPKEILDRRIVLPQGV